MLYSNAMQEQAQEFIAAVSPALESLLKRLFKGDMLTQLVDAFMLVWQAGGDSEGDIVRAEGVSFNPRLARLAQIVLLDSRSKLLRASDPQDELQHAAELVVAVWLASLPNSQYRQLSFKISAQHRRTSIIAGLAREIASGDLSGGPIGPEGIVAAALILDRVRHLHMTPLTIEQRLKELTQLERTSLELLALDHIQPIRDKLLSAISKAKNTGNKRYVPLSA